MLAQALSLAKKTGTVIAPDGELCRMHVDTLCLQGDGPRVLEFARTLRSGLEQAGVVVASHV
jgi:lactam utilization protein B